MPKANLIYKSNETIFGKFDRSGEWAEYSATISIKENVKTPIEIKMKLEDQPCFLELPKQKVIKAEDITTAYEKVAKFFRINGLEFR